MDGFRHLIEPVNPSTARALVERLFALSGRRHHAERRGDGHDQRRQRECKENKDEKNSDYRIDRYGHARGGVDHMLARVMVGLFAAQLDGRALVPATSFRYDLWRRRRFRGHPGNLASACRSIRGTAVALGFRAMVAAAWRWLASSPRSAWRNPGAGPLLLLHASPWSPALSRSSNLTESKDCRRVATTCCQKIWI